MKKGVLILCCMLTALGWVDAAAQISKNQGLSKSKIAVPHSDRRIFYFGAWQPAAQDSNCTYTERQYSACEFFFRGSFIAWVGSKRPDGGLADVFIDGVYQTTVDGYADRTIPHVVRFKKSGLTPGRLHKIRIEAKKKHSTKAQAYLDVVRFECSEAVDYISMMKTKMEAEYAQRRSGKRHDPLPAAWAPVADKATLPKGGVALHGGDFKRVFDNNIRYLDTSFKSRDYCAQPENWSKWLPASNEGRLLAGAAHASAWSDDRRLQPIIQKVLADVEARMRPDGYYNYYSEADSYQQTTHSNSERKNYDRVFWTRGLLAAGAAGYTGAYHALRRMYDWFNASPYLPFMLNGNNATNGLPGGPLVYLSPIGKPADLTATIQHYDQEFWMAELKKGEPFAFCFYPGERPHCYDLLGLEAFTDEYKATGAAKYLDAVLGGWAVYKNHYKHVGGATALCEANGPYPPQSYYLTTGHTGETCGSVFWINLNKKLALLFPDEEKYQAEIEESLYNVLFAAQDGAGFIRYHNVLHGTKEGANCKNTCCEVSLCGLLGQLPQFLYSFRPDGIAVNLYAPSEVAWAFEKDSVRLTTETAFPQHNPVALTINTKQPARFTLRVRVPSWATTPMTLTVNGVAAGTGKPSSFYPLDRTWRDGDVVRFNLPASFRTVPYTGLDQTADNKDRYALLYGPVLMAAVGDSTLKNSVPQFKMTPAAFLKSIRREAGLQGRVPGYEQHLLVPYYKISGETFTCFPVIQE